MVAGAGVAPKRLVPVPVPVVPPNSDDVPVEGAPPNREEVAAGVEDAPKRLVVVDVPVPCIRRGREMLVYFLLIIEN